MVAIAGRPLIGHKNRDMLTSWLYQQLLVGLSEEFQEVGPLKVLYDKVIGQFDLFDYLISFGEISTYWKLWFLIFFFSYLIFIWFWNFSFSDFDFFDFLLFLIFWFFVCTGIAEIFPISKHHYRKGEQTDRQTNIACFQKNITDRGDRQTDRQTD